MKPVHLKKTPYPTEVNRLIELGHHQLREAGFKITKKRTEILSLFADNQRYLTALTIHKALEEVYPTMSYNTTYRNLYDFVEIGLLESTEYQNEQLFRLSCQLGHDCHHHHHHFICVNCGKALVLDACPLEQVHTDLSSFKVLSHRFEVFGLCEDCQLLPESELQ
ncbi:Fur family transcriptional regulator [Facklamia hominis]|uniref:Fur family transcriptional regulator n=1 Tax=Facklamia hominis TaxID=178214 RepID=UPI00035384FC|nr:Fur family transcriptional regulator [Facklamia hominis]EPH12885.1 hypothetical protein HMPREF9260_00473 [Facklamia hominis ACS-120-V-Sch10]